jgi:hypothetical protein
MRGLEGYGIEGEKKTRKGKAKALCCPMKQKLLKKQRISEGKRRN